MFKNFKVGISGLLAQKLIFRPLKKVLDLSCFFEYLRGTSGMKNTIIIECKIQLQKMIQISQIINTETNLVTFKVIDSLFMVPFLFRKKQLLSVVIREKKLLGVVIREKNLLGVVIREKRSLGVVTREKKLFGVVTREKKLLGVVIRKKNCSASLLGKKHCWASVLGKKNCWASLLGKLFFPKF